MTEKDPPSPLEDPLFVAAIAAMIVVGLVAILDLLQDGKIDATVLGLFISVFGPLTPALIMRRRNGREH